MKKELTKKERRELLTKKKLIDAAKELFRTKGYKNTSVDEISDEAVLSKGTFYQYFKSKENLFLETLRETERDIIDLIDEKVLSNEKLTKKELLEELFVTLLDYFEKDYYAIHLSFYKEPNFNNEIVESMRSFVINLMGAISKVFEKVGLKDPAESRNIAYSMLGAIYFHIAHWFFNLKDQKVSLKETAKVIFSHFYPYFNQK